MGHFYFKSGPLAHKLVKKTGFFEKLVKNCDFVGHFAQNRDKTGTKVAHKFLRFLAKKWQKMAKNGQKTAFLGYFWCFSRKI